MAGKDTQSRQLSANASEFVPPEYLILQSVDQVPSYPGTMGYPSFPFNDVAGSGHTRCYGSWQGPGRPINPNDFDPRKVLPYTDLSGAPITANPYESPSMGLSAYPLQHLGQMPPQQQQQQFQYMYCHPSQQLFAQPDLPQYSIYHGSGGGPTLIPHDARVFSQDCSSHMLPNEGIALPCYLPGQYGSAVVFQQHQGMPEAMTHRPKKKKKQKHSNSNQVSIGVQYHSDAQEHGLLLEASDQKSGHCPTRTMIFKDCEVQTDFSDDIANKNLLEKASPLYGTRLHKWLQTESSTDSEELDSDSGYSASPLRRNVQTNSVASSAVVPGIPTGISPGIPTGIPTGISTGIPTSIPTGIPTGIPGSSWMTANNPLLFPYNQNNSTYVIPTVQFPMESMINGEIPQFTFQSNSANVNGLQRYAVPPRVQQHVASTESVPAQTKHRLNWRTMQNELKKWMSSKNDCDMTNSEIADEFMRLLDAAGGLASPPGERTGATMSHNFSDSVLERGNCGEYGTNQFLESNMTNKKTASVSVKDCLMLPKSLKKKQRKQEQLSRAADEELAEISLEQQVLREISTGRRKISLDIPQFLADSIDYACDPEIEMPPDLMLMREDDTISLPDSQFRLQGRDSATFKVRKQSPLKKVILKEREENRRFNGSFVNDISLPADGFELRLPALLAASPINVNDLSQETTSSKNSSLDNDGGTPQSADHFSPISQTSPLSIGSPMCSPPFLSGMTTPDEFPKSTIISHIHSRRFREYCSQMLSRDIDDCCINLLQRLVKVQDHSYLPSGDNKTSTVKRQTVLGLREVTKHLKNRNLKCVIISPNMERIQSKGGLDEALYTIIRLCQEQKVLVVFALGRRALGRACAKLVPVSVVGIFSFDGAEEHFHKLQELVKKARNAYNEMVSNLEQQVHPTDNVSSSSMGGVHSLHSRTSSAGSILSFTSSILSEPISENDPNFEPETDSRGYEIELPSIEQLGLFDTPDCINEQDDVDNGLELSENGSECNASDNSKVVVIEPLNYEADSEDDHGYSPISSHSEDNGTPCNDLVRNLPDTSRAESPDLSSDLSQHSSQMLVTFGRHVALKDWSQKSNVMNGDIVKPLVKPDVYNDENLDINQVNHIYANGDVHDGDININGCQSVPSMHCNGENDLELT